VAAAPVLDTTPDDRFTNRPYHIHTDDPDESANTTLPEFNHAGVPNDTVTEPPLTNRTVPALDTVTEPPNCTDPDTVTVAADPIWVGVLSALTMKVALLISTAVLFRSAATLAAPL